jgi:hypothetical protein
MVKSSRRGLSCPIGFGDGTAFLNSVSPGGEIVLATTVVATCEFRGFREYSRPARDRAATSIRAADCGTVLADASRPFGAPYSRAIRNADRKSASRGEAPGVPLSTRVKLLGTGVLSSELAASGATHVLTVEVEHRAPETSEP